MLVNTTFQDICFAVDRLWTVLNEAKGWDDKNSISSINSENWSEIVDAMKSLEEELEIDRDENGEYYCTAI